MRKKLIPSLVATVMLVTTIGSDLTTAGATSNRRAQPGCVGPVQNRFVGYANYASPPANWNETPIGARATIMVRHPSVCATDDYPMNFSTAWVMIADQTAYTRYAQAGYMRTPNLLPNGTLDSCKRHFAEYDQNFSGSGFVRTFTGACLAVGVAHQYRVEFLGDPGPYPGPSASNVFGLYSGNTLISTNTVDVWTSGWSFTPQYLGETTYAASDVPGTTAATATFSTMQIQSVDTGSYRSTPCYLAGFNDTARYHRNASSCTNAWIWTNPL